MPPKDENKYVYHKIPCDKIIAASATCVTISCIIGYFVYLVYR